MSASQETFIAITRFGLGAKHGDFSGISGDPRGWLKSQLKPDFLQSPALNSLSSTMESIQHLRQDNEMKKQMKDEAAATTDEASKAKFADMIKQANQGLSEDYI